MSEADELLPGPLALSPLVLSRDESRAVDRLALEKFGISGLVLMENAGRNLIEPALAMAFGPGPIRIVCGLGNNGGDGFVLARHLMRLGRGFELVLLGTRGEVPKTSDAAINYRILKSLGAEPRWAPDASVLRSFLCDRPRASLIVDAWLGTGLSRALDQRSCELVEAINAAGAEGTPILAVDTPSGLDVDSGQPMGAAVRATRTVTMVSLKPGFLKPEAQAFCGELQVVDIGLPLAPILSLLRSA